MPNGVKNGASISLDAETISLIDEYILYLQKKSKVTLALNRSGVARHLLKTIIGKEINGKN